MEQLSIVIAMSLQVLQGQMEAEELLAQKKLRNEAIQLEDLLAQVRKEYEMLRIEFEQNLAANEQTGPINKEMRNLITRSVCSVQTFVSFVYFTFLVCKLTTSN